MFLLPSGNPQSAWPGNRRCSGKGFRFLLPLVLVFAESCNFPRPAGNVFQAETASPDTAKTVEAAAIRKEAALTTLHSTPKPTADWTGGTFRVETKDLVIEYPDFIDPVESQKHADTLQKAYETYLLIFGFDDEKPYGGIKTNIVLNPEVKVSSAGPHQITIGSTTINEIKMGSLNPPDITYFHEMVHVFEFAEWDAERYYIFHMIAGINEAFASYLACHPDILSLVEQNANAKPACDVILYGIGAKGPAFTLAYYEAQKIDPYTLDWGRHPAGQSGENYFIQMLARVSEMAGWNVWINYFSAIRQTSIRPDVWKAAEVKMDDMHDPLAKQAFAEFVTDLSGAAGQDLRPMFRGWGFDL